MTLDHIVIHLDADDLGAFKRELDEAGVPFEPGWGKKAKGFRVANLWVGAQYLELVEIVAPENLWQPRWSRRHAEGERGVYCLFLKIDETVEALYERLTAAGLSPSEPERTRFKWLFGLLEKKLPWQFILLPQIPGTPVELGFIHYDTGAEAKAKPYMVPNTEDVGMTGLTGAAVLSREPSEASAWLETLAEAVGRTLPVHVLSAEGGEVLRVRMVLEPGKTFAPVEVGNLLISG